MDGLVMTYRCGRPTLLQITIPSVQELRILGAQDLRSSGSYRSLGS